MLHKGTPGRWSTWAYHSQRWSSRTWRTSGGTACGACLPISNSDFAKESFAQTFISDHMVAYYWKKQKQKGMPWCISKRILNRTPPLRKMLLCSLPHKVLECCLLLPELSNLLFHWNPYNQGKQNKKQNRSLASTDLSFAWQKRCSWVNSSVYCQISYL